MPYTAEISRTNPSCILFLIDQSGSMSDPFGGQPGRSKAERLADAINRLLFELTIRCTKDQSEGVRNYYEVGVIGYGPQVGPALADPVTEIVMNQRRALIPISEVADNPARIEERRRRVEDGAGGLIEETVRFPIWFDPEAANGTPMGAAFQMAYAILEPWTLAHPNSFPPIMINITDGEPNPDSDPRGPADAIRRLGTRDGTVLLFNLHLSSHPGAPIMYPESDAGLPDLFARMLFQISSPLPPHIQHAARSEQYVIGSQARGFVFNADIVEVIKFIDIGTRPRGLR